MPRSSGNELEKVMASENKVYHVILNTGSRSFEVTASSMDVLEYCVCFKDNAGETVAAVPWSELRFVGEREVTKRIKSQKSTTGQNAAGKDAS